MSALGVTYLIGACVGLGLWVVLLGAHLASYAFWRGMSGEQMAARDLITVVRSWWMPLAWPVVFVVAVALVTNAVRKSAT